MLKVLGCITYEHNLWLVALSAAICALGCFTTTCIGERGSGASQASSLRWSAAAAVVFGCSVWSLHFVAMLAFEPANQTRYHLALTVFSAIVAVAGSFAAFRVWKSSLSRLVRVSLAGYLLGLSVTGMHYIGAAAMTFASLVSYDQTYVTASIVVSIVFCVIAFSRAADLSSMSRRVEVSIWLSLAICGLHFTGMTAITMAPITVDDEAGGLLGTTALAIAVGTVSVAILIASLVAIMLDQHLSRRAVQELDRMRLMSNLAHEVILIHRDGIVLEVNKAGERLLKTTTENIVGKPLSSFFSESSLPALVRRELCAPAERVPEEFEIQIVDGSHVAVELSCQPVNFMGKPSTVIALRDLTDRKRDEARIRHSARHDALTNLPNRYTLLERLDQALDTAAQRKGAMAVVFIDLDQFKPVNDTYGHAAGDNLLIQVSKRIQSEIKTSDTLARIGGDEFVMILTEAPQPQRASSVATRVLELLRKPFMVDGQQIEIGASMGIALYPEDGATADTLMRAADVAMYRVKEEGRGSLRFYEASMNAQLHARMQTQKELAVAIDRGELALHYQPIVNGKTGKVETFEALIRWHHPHRGLVSPAEFIPLAEQTGLIDRIGSWVIETACQEAVQWEQPWRVAVNVSPKQFQQSDVCEAIIKSLGTYGLAASRLVVEVTEGILIDDADEAVKTLNRLREIGVRVALDDFGTGYSSLSYLQLFKFDKFKIDQSFIKKLGESEDALTITRTIVNLGHNLGLNVTAEGVETKAQLAMLQQLGCDQIQGYLVARPAPIKKFTRNDSVRVQALFAESHIQLTA